MYSYENIANDRSSGALNTDQDNYDAPIVENIALRYSSPGVFGSKTKRYSLKRDVTTIGRASTNSLSFDDPKQSRSHAKIELKHGKPPVIYDLGSTYGTTVNDQPITKQALRIGDKITVGNTTLVLEGMYHNIR